MSRKAAFTCLFPSLAFLAFMVGWPLLQAMRLSLTWVASGEFPTLETWTRYVFGLRAAHTAYSSALTAFYAAASVFLEVAIALASAWILKRRFSGRGILRAVLLAPLGIPVVVAAQAFLLLFSVPQAGRLSGSWVPVLSAEVWIMLPLVTLVLLAGLESIPESVYEAAKVYGAGPWRRFRTVTLPLMAPFILTAFLLRASQVFQMFTLPYLLGRTGVYDQVVSVLAYEQHLAALIVPGMTQASANAYSLLMLALAASFMAVLAGAYGLLKIVSERRFGYRWSRA